MTLFHFAEVGTLAPTLGRNVYNNDWKRAEGLTLCLTVTLGALSLPETRVSLYLVISVSISNIVPEGS